MIVNFLPSRTLRWYGHVLRREEDNVLKKALRFTVEGLRRRGRPRKTWKRQVEESIKTVGLKKEDALDRAKWKEGAKLIAPGVRCIRATLINGDKTGLKLEEKKKRENKSSNMFIVRGLMSE